MKECVLIVGIAGYGLVGKTRRNCIDTNPNFRLVAVCDIRMTSDATMIDGSTFQYEYSTLESTYTKEGHSGVMRDGVNFYTGYESMLEEESLDVLFVCLPNYLAPKVTMMALQKGIHVFCEKPPGRTVDDVREVMRIEGEQPGLKLKYGFNHRYHESVKETKNTIASGRFGDVINFRGVYGKSRIIPWEGGWRSKKKYAGGGILLDQGIHMLDMIRYLGGDFEEVKSFVSNEFWQRDVEDNAYILMRNNNGCCAMLHSTATQWQHKFRLEITLNEAILELTGILSGSKSYGAEKLKIVQRKDQSLTGSQEESVYTYLEDNSWQEEVDEFAEIIINNRPVVNGASFEALKVMELVYMIYASDESWSNQSFNS